MADPERVALLCSESLGLHARFAPVNRGAVGRHASVGLSIVWIVASEMCAHVADADKSHIASGLPRAAEP
jgi:hypothetical protein